LISGPFLEWNFNERINVICQIEGRPKLGENISVCFCNVEILSLVLACYCLNSDGLCQARPVMLWFGGTPYIIATNLV
jgi:hypothetical protein